MTLELRVVILIASYDLVGTIASGHGSGYVQGVSPPGLLQLTSVIKLVMVDPQLGSSPPPRNGVYGVTGNNLTNFHRGHRHARVVW